MVWGKIGRNKLKGKSKGRERVVRGEGKEKRGRMERSIKDK